MLKSLPEGTRFMFDKLEKSLSCTKRWLSKNTDGRSGGFSGAKAYMWYVKWWEKFHDTVDRSIYDAIMFGIDFVVIKRYQRVSVLLNTSG